MYVLRRSALFLYLLVLLFLKHGRASEQDAAFFETRIRPILATKCSGCHGPDQQLSSLRVDSREALLKGGKRGASVVAGEPDSSLLIKAVRQQGELKMPPGGKLKEQEVAALEKWVSEGAYWPKTTIISKGPGQDRYAELVRTHWAFQKIKTPLTVPEGSAENPVDRFLLSKLKASGLQYAKPADRRTLIRRLSYVLTGLPPTPEEVDSFVRDPSPTAYEALVERTLASPHFGEQWGRHWLDLVRYAETRGYEWNYEIIGAWRYRDYIIRALNADVPYDQLIREHIAGDLLPKPRINAKEGINESVIGTSFYRLGEAGHDDCTLFREIALDVVDNEIDTLSKTFQGLTVACARCHNHKLDPIPTEDYYGLYSILNSSRTVTHTVDLPGAGNTNLTRMQELKQDVRNELAKSWRDETGHIRDGILAALRSKDSTDIRAEAWRKALASAGQNIDNPGYPLAQLRCETASSERWVPGSAASMAALYFKEQSARAEFNQKNFQAFPFADWYASGNGLKSGQAKSGELTLAGEGETVVSGVLGQGIYTNLLSSRQNGALRSQYLSKDYKYLSIRVMGGGLASRRTVIDNCAIGENYKVLENDSPTWIRLDTFSKEAKLPVFVELVTRSDNPRIPDRPEVLKPYQVKLIDSPESWFGISGAVLHNSPETPKEDLAHMLPLFEGGPIRTWRQLAERYQKVIGGAVERWSEGKATESDARWLDWLARNNLLPNRSAASLKLSALVTEYRRLHSEIPAPRVVEGLADMGDGRDYPVLLAGNSSNPGDPAPRRYLRRIFDDSPIKTSGSGRRELAETIASPENPLTARVMTNRIWTYVFGRGIVPSVDNFGLLGDRPSHPELLDYLASRFVSSGWSIKQAVRLLVTSEAFRQSGEVNPAAREMDAENRLLHHYPLRRLEAESIRDSILMASGELKSSMFGPSTDPYRDQAKDYRRLFSGPLDGGGRRSLYLKVTRMEGNKLLDTFDYPNPMATRGNRDVTNVPAQALTMLNDPFVKAEAEKCARLVLAERSQSVDQTVERVFRTALARTPTDAERERFHGLAAELASLHGIAREEMLQSVTVWADVVHAVFNLKEFLYVQ